MKILALISSNIRPFESCSECHIYKTGEIIGKVIVNHFCWIKWTTYLYADWKCCYNNGSWIDTWHFVQKSTPFIGAEILQAPNSLLYLQLSEVQVRDEMY